MGILTDILSPVAGGFIKDVGDTVRQFVTTDKDKLELELKLKEMENSFILKMTENTNAYEEQVTQRHNADMTSDSWLSKNIRPLTLIFILVMYSLLSISSGFEFRVTQAYIELLGQWGMLIMSFYFGGRTIEKVASVIKNGSSQ